MNCPICDYKGLADDATNCPSCNADLSAYRALDTVEHAMEKQKKRTLLFIILFFIALLGCIAIYIIFNTGSDVAEQEPPAQAEVENQAMIAENAKLTNDIEKLQGEITVLKQELETARENQLTTHVISRGETLFLIAEQYFGDGQKYPKLAADNCIEDPDLIFAGNKLIILK